VLAQYGIKQTRDNRVTGGKLNIRDVMSKYCQDRKGVVVERIDKFNERDDCWEEAVVVDTRNAPVPSVVAFRVDFRNWLRSLSPRDRRIAKYLSLGNRTQDVARKFSVSAGRVSQLRRELAKSWGAFVGEPPLPDAGGEAAA
jgi:DNA-binding NarL/FixJ family response regulator